MITSDTLTVEAKGIDAVEIRSLCRVIMVTNSEWAVPASGDERRYFVLDVGSGRRQDHAYFAAIHEQLNGNDREGLRALLAFLLKFPVGRYNLRRVPETMALRSQRALSLDLHAQFILDSLLGWRIAGVSWSWGAIVSKDAVHDAYCDASKKRGKSHLMAPSVFAKQFIATTGAKTTRPRTGGLRVCSWELPAWEEAAACFEARYRVDARALAETEDDLDEGPF